MAVRVQGEEGEIRILRPIYRPIRFRIVKKGGAVQETDMNPEKCAGAHGMMYEANEEARCLVGGKLESITVDAVEREGCER